MICLFFFFCSDTIQKPKILLLSVLFCLILLDGTTGTAASKESPQCGTALPSIFFIGNISYKLLKEIRT